MFNRYKTKGVFLSFDDKGESDKFLTAYTEEFGKTKVFAKSIRKNGSKLRFGARFFLVNEIEFIEGKNYRTLTDIRIIRNHENIVKNLTKTAFGSKMCEDLDLLLKEDQKDNEIWDLLIETLDDLNKENKYSDFLIYYRFIWKLFLSLGYRPELYRCICLKNIRKKPLYFSVKEGGVIGECCFQENNDFFSVSDGVVKTLRIFLENKKEIVFKLKIDSQTKKELEIITEKYLKNLS